MEQSMEAEAVGREARNGVSMGRRLCSRLQGLVLGGNQCAWEEAGELRAMPEAVLLGRVSELSQQQSPMGFLTAHSQ